MTRTTPHKRIFILPVLLSLYGLLVLRAGSGTPFYMIWFFAAAGCLAHGLLKSNGVYKRIPRVFRYCSFGCAGLMVLLFVIVESLVVSGFFQSGREDLDYIVVLGAQVYESGPSVVLRYRLDRAAGYLTADPRTKCVVTGGRGYNEPYTEAEGMAAYLVERGIDRDRILLEDRALNTTQNIAYSAEVIGADGGDIMHSTVGIVTNDFHVFRGTAIAGKYGYAKVCGIAAGSNPLYLPNNMLREFFGICKDAVYGNL